MKLTVFALSALLFSTAAAAQIGSSSSSSAPEPSAAAGRPVTSRAQSGEPAERLICRRIQTTGTRNGHRVCMTARQWRDYERS